MATELLGTEDEDNRVLDRHEEEDDHDASDTAGPVDDRSQYGEGEAHRCVDEQEEIGGDPGEKGGTDESSDGEDQERHRKKQGRSTLGVASVLVDVVDEEGSNGDLGSDVGELGNETTKHVVLLPEGFVGVRSSLALLGIGHGLEELLRDLGHSGA